MRYALLIGLLGLGLLLAGHTRGQVARRLPIPSKAAQARVETLIRELYKEELARAEKDAAARGRLAETLLYEGRETKDDPAGRYVLFREAYHLAARAGAVATALQATDELAAAFTIPEAQLARMRVDLLKEAAATRGAPQQAYRAVIDRALAALEDALERDDHATAVELLEAAELAGRRLKHVPTVATLRSRLDEARRRRTEFAAWQPYAARLAKNPTDAEACLEMGKYQALVKGRWDRGLPLLARGTGPLAKLALAEQKSNPGADKLAHLAEQWRQQAREQKGALRAHALLHAYDLYLRALAGADDALRRTIEPKMRAVAESLPAEYRIGAITTELRVIEAPVAGPFYGAVFSPDGRFVLSTGSDNQLHVWGARTGREVRSLPGHTGRLWTVAAAPDGQHAASGGFDTSIRLWDYVSGRELRVLPGHKDYVRSVAFTPDGRRLLSGGDDRLLRLWDVTTGKEIQSFSGHAHFVWSVAVSPDGTRGLSGSLDRTVRLWDLTNGKELRRLEGHADTVLAVAFTPDGRHAVSGSTDRTVKLWNLETGQPVRTFTGHSGHVHAVAVSPDGRRILSAGQDRTLRLWDTQTGEELRRLEGHRDTVWSVAFARDGRFAVSAGQDNTIRLWGSGAP